VREAYPDLPIVGFKAETSGDDAGDGRAEAIRIRDRVGLVFVVANASVMGDDETRVLLVGDEGTEPTEAVGSKDTVAGQIADRLAGRRTRVVGVAAESIRVDSRSSPRSPRSRRGYKLF